MNLREQYRQWKEQWPEASKWAVPLWLGCALLVGVLIWGIYRDLIQTGERTAPAPVAAASRPRPLWPGKAVTAAARFPLDSGLGQEAGFLLRSAGPGGLRTIAPGGDAWAARAFALEDGPETRVVLRALLQQSGPKPEESEARLAGFCHDRPESAAAYAGWLMIQDRWADALSWINGLSPAVASRSRIRALRADLLCRTGDFDGARDALDLGAWGQPDPATIDLALCAALAGERQRGDLRDRLWIAALERSGKDADSLRILLRLALNFGLGRECDRTFRAVLALRPDDRDTASQYQDWLRLHPDQAPSAPAGAT